MEPLNLLFFISRTVSPERSDIWVDSLPAKPHEPSCTAVTAPDASQPTPVLLKENYNNNNNDNDDDK